MKWHRMYLPRQRASGSIRMIMTQTCGYRSSKSKRYAKPKTRLLLLTENRIQVEAQFKALVDAVSVLETSAYIVSRHREQQMSKS